MCPAMAESSFFRDLRSLGRSVVLTGFLAWVICFVGLISFHTHVSSTSMAAQVSDAPRNPTFPAANPNHDCVFCQMIQTAGKVLKVSCDAGLNLPAVTPACLPVTPRLMAIAVVFVADSRAPPISLSI